MAPDPPQGWLCQVMLAMPAISAPHSVRHGPAAWPPSTRTGFVALRWPLAARNRGFRLGLGRTPRRPLPFVVRAIGVDSRIWVELTGDDAIRREPGYEPEVFNRSPPNLAVSHRDSRCAQHSAQTPRSIDVRCVRTHDLRHFAGTTAGRVATVAEIKERMGHSTFAAAMRYRHSADGRGREVAQALSKLAQDAETGG
jgi:hypothetical protein